MKRAVVVFSGGQDSTTCLVQALQQYDEVMNLKLMASRIRLSLGVIFCS